MNKEIETIPDDTQTMTLKEVCDLTETRHSDAMLRIMPKLLKKESFGMSTQIAHSYTMPNGGQREIQTYLLNKNQSLVVAAKLSDEFLIRVIKRWQELESDGRPMTREELLVRLIDVSQRELLLINQTRQLEHDKQELKITLDEEQTWSSIKRQEKEHGASFKWQQLKSWSIANGYEIKRVFDQNYGEVNSYHADAWLAVYGVEIK